MGIEKKTFAFKLAEKNESGAKWKARPGVTAMGCTDPSGLGEHRSAYDSWGNYRGRDGGEWC